MWTRGRRRNNVPRAHIGTARVWCDPSTRCSNSLNAGYISTSSFNFTMVRWFPLTFINRRALTRSEYQTMENILMGAHICRSKWDALAHELVNFQVDEGLTSVCLRSPMCRQDWSQLALSSLFTAKSYFLCFVKTWECFWPPAPPCAAAYVSAIWRSCCWQLYTFERTIAFRAPPRMLCVSMPGRTVIQSKHFHTANTMREIVSRAPLLFKIVSNLYLSWRRSTGRGQKTVGHERRANKQAHNNKSWLVIR